MKTTFLSLCILLTVSFSISAQEANKTKPVPNGMTATKVIDNYIKAIGGKKQIDKVKTMKIIYVMEIMGQPFEMTRKMAAPNKEFAAVKTGEMLFQKQVFDGKKGYSIVQGQRVELSGEALKFAQSKTLPIEDLAYKSGKLDRIQEVDGKDNYVIKVGNQEVYYDVKSGLKLKLETLTENSKGKVKVPTIFSDYKEVDGILIPHKYQIQSQIKMDYTIKEIKINQGVEDKDFE